MGGPAGLQDLGGFRGNCTEDVYGLNRHLIVWWEWAEATEGELLYLWP